MRKVQAVNQLNKEKRIEAAKFKLIKDFDETDFPKIHWANCDKVVFNKANLLITSLRVELGKTNVEGEESMTLSGLSFFY